MAVDDRLKLVWKHLGDQAAAVGSAVSALELMSSELSFPNDVTRATFTRTIALLRRTLGDMRETADGLDLRTTFDPSADLARSFGIPPALLRYLLQQQVTADSISAALALDEAGRVEPENVVTARRLAQSLSEALDESALKRHVDPLGELNAPPPKSRQ